MDKKFSTGNGWKSWKFLHRGFSKKFEGKRKKCLTEGHSVRYTVELQACPHFGTRIDPITGDEFLRRIQPWRELFSPRSVSARKFMAFWPAWAPRTAARSSMLAVQRAARAWLSDPALLTGPGAEMNMRTKDRWYWIGGLIFLEIWKNFRKFARMGFQSRKNFDILA